MAVIGTFRTSKQKHFLTESPGGKSARVHGRECIGVSSRGSTEISSHVHSFQVEENATNDAVFFSTAEISRRKTDDSNIRIRANKYYVLFQF